jgi:hypothetical protein
VIYRFRDGIVREYAPPGLMSYAVQPTEDGRSVWSAGPESMLLIDVDSGAVTIGPSSDIGWLPSALAIYGVPRANVQASLAAVPTLSRASLAILASALVILSLAFLGPAAGKL